MLKQQQSSNNKPHAGVGVIIRQNRKVILGRRLNRPMAGSWQLPGGWIHFAETPEQAVHRQLNQFEDLHVGKIQFVAYTNNVFDEHTHSLSLYFMVDCLNNDPQKLINKNNTVEWLWADWNKLPEPLFLPLQLLKQSGFNLETTFEREKDA